MWSVGWSFLSNPPMYPDASQLLRLADCFAMSRLPSSLYTDDFRDYCMAVVYAYPLHKSAPTGGRMLAAVLEQGAEYVSRDRQLAIFGHEVRRAREAKGWSKAELARQLGLKAPSAVSQWEAGESGITEQRLVDLEHVLDRQGELGWIVGMGQPPTKAQPSIEAAIEADDELTSDEKRWMLAGLAEIRRIAAERRGAADATG